MSAEPSDVVGDLNRLMAEEAEACLRYFQIRFRLRGKGRRVAEQFFEDALRETLEHADAIAKQIHALGHVPTLNIHLSLGGGPLGPDEALSEALDIEQQALDAYKDLLPRVAAEPVLEEFIRAQIEIETEHVQEIRDALHVGATLKLVGPPAAGADSVDSPDRDDE